MITDRRQRFNPLDRFLRRLRARPLVDLVPPGSRVLDVGCGTENWLVRSFATWGVDSLGIDPHLEAEFVDHHGRRDVIVDVEDREPASFDVATSLAVIEHLPVESVGSHLKSIRNALRPDGLLVLTTPTPRSRPVLEFLAYRLHVISADEIRDHRHYYDEGELIEMLGANGFDRVEHASFQFGLNQRVLARRPVADEVVGS